MENVNTMVKMKEKEHSHMIAMARLVVKKLYSVQKTLQYGKKRVSENISNSARRWQQVQKPHTGDVALSKLGIKS